MDTIPDTPPPPAKDEASSEKSMHEVDHHPLPSIPNSPITPMTAQPLLPPQDENDITDDTGRLMFPNKSSDDVSEPVSRVSTRPSKQNLHITVPPKEPQPWDLVDPPKNNGMSAKEQMELEAGTGVGAGLGVGNGQLKKMSSIRKIQKPRHPKIPKSSYYFGPPSPTSAYGTPPQGIIGIHHPREILRIERDYSGGEIIQFAPIYPLELEGRINPTQFLSSINSINEILISAHSIRHTFLDNALAVFTLQLSRALWSSWYDKQMKRLEELFDDLNKTLYNPAGLNLVWPRKVGFLFLEIEYY